MTQNLLFVFANRVIKELDLFVKKNGKLHSLGKTGTDYPFYRRPYTFPVFIYPLAVEPKKTTTYYLAIDPKGLSLQISLMVFSKTEIRKQEMQLYLVFGLFSGIIVLVGLFNLFLFFAIKERIHFLYFIYSIAVRWLLLSLEALDFQFFFPGNPYYFILSRHASVYMLIGMLLFVMQEFLRQTSANSYFYTFVYLLKWSCMVLPLVDFLINIDNRTHPFVTNLYYTSYRLLQSVALLLVLLSCIEKIRQGYRLAIFYLAAIAVFLFGLIISVMNVAGIINMLPMPPTILETGIVIEAIIISFGILYRYNFFKREKEQLAKQLLHQQSALGEQILKTQEDERKRIAEDLHDELGSSLAALKLQLQKSSLQNNELEVILNVVDRASSDTRNISHDLMPPEFKKTSLHKILTNYYSRLNTEINIKFDFVSTGSNGHFAKQDELIIYRIIMELTTNILKHSAATEATIQIIYYEKDLHIMTEDNGKGINKDATGGIGLRNIQSRVNYLRGQMNIDSNQNGTTIIIQLPYKLL